MMVATMILAPSIRGNGNLCYCIGSTRPFLSLKFVNSFPDDEPSLFGDYQPSQRSGFPTPSRAHSPDPSMIVDLTKQLSSEQQRAELLEANLHHEREVAELQVGAAENEVFCYHKIYY